MKTKKTIRAITGIALCLAGYAMVRVSRLPYRESTVVIDAGGCRMVTDVIDLGNDDTRGSVILLHGLSANKEIMGYIAQGFARQNLRVFVPDLPGHGRTDGPFSFVIAENCSEALFRQLVSHRAIEPSATILVGHSMGGAIAMRIAARNAVAGVVAISPAPMPPGGVISVHVVAGFDVRGKLPRPLLPYEPPASAENTLAISAADEPAILRNAARDLLAAQHSASDKYMALAHATHVSMLFDARVVRESQEWANRVLHLEGATSGGFPLALAGGLAGLVGLLLLAGPFLREAVGEIPAKHTRGDSDEFRVDAKSEQASGTAPGIARICLEMAGVSIATVLVLHFGDPLRFVHIFEGSYFASFLAIAGIFLLALHFRSLRALWPARLGPIAGASFAAFVLLLLITAWLSLTMTEAWMTAARWERFPLMLAAVFPYHAAEEILLGAHGARSGKARLLLTMLLRLIAWVVLVLALFLLGAPTILLILLALYFAVFSALQRAGMNVVRQETRSALAAAIFGAILLAGSCMVIFPIT